jgi:hypothetical protein
MSLRVAYPTVTDCGLGNNLMAVAKAYLIAQSCQLKYQPPVWPPTIHVKPATKNGYGYYFPSSSNDRVRTALFAYSLRLQRKLKFRIGPPVLEFTRESYERTRIQDIGEACLGYLKGLGFHDPVRSVVVTTGGMWGGYAAIKRARVWLQSLLLSHSETRRRLEELEAPAKGRLRIGVNIRMGDFKPWNGTFEEGERVAQLPLDWYVRMCRLIREACDCEFILVTDGTREQLRPFLDEIRPINYLGQPYSDLLGLLLLSRSDLVVCSNSTYSRLACFLNDKPYIWISDTLVRDRSNGHGYLWKENGTPRTSRIKAVPVKDDASREAIRRCFALSHKTCALPEGLSRFLTSGGAMPIENWDDLLYGDAVFLM